MRNLVLNYIYYIYYIYVSVETVIAIYFFNKNGLTYQLLLSIPLISLILITLLFFTKGFSDSQVYYNFLSNSMIFALSLQSYYKEMKYVFGAVFIILFSYYFYLKYQDDRNNKDDGKGPTFFNK